MNLSFNSLLLAILFFLFLLKLTSKSTKRNGARLPPGPWQLPVIGSLHHLVGKLPHHALRDLAKTHGPLMRLKLGENSTVVVSSAEVVREMTKTQDKAFSSRPDLVAAKITIYGGRDLLFAPYGEYWRQLRKLFVVELLSTKRVQSFESVRQAEIDKMVRTIESTHRAPINVTAMLHCLAADMTTGAAFGSKCEDKETFLAAMKQILRYGTGLSLADLFPSVALVRVLSGIDWKLGKLHRKIDTILDSIIEEHKEGRAVNAKQQEENFLDVLLRLQEDSGHGSELLVTSTIIKALILDVFQAGSGSSASVLSWAMSELIKHPRVMEKAQGEVRQAFAGKTKITEKDVDQLSYLKLVIKEALRLHPPAPLLVPRVCTESCEINGYQIPVNTRVLINAWAMGRDPKYWQHPDDFKPERFQGTQVDYIGANYEYIPFGAGRRICPGILFAVSGMEHGLARLLYHFQWSLPDGMKPEDLDMSETSGLAARRKHDLILRATPYVAPED